MVDCMAKTLCAVAFSLSYDVLQHKYILNLCCTSQCHIVSGLCKTLQISEEKVSRAPRKVLKWYSAIQKDEEKGAL